MKAAEQHSELRSLEATISKVTVGLICWASALTVCIGVMTVFVFLRMRSLRERARRLAASDTSKTAAAVPSGPAATTANGGGRRRRQNNRGQTSSSRRRPVTNLSRMISVDGDNDAAAAATRTSNVVAAVH